MRAGWKIKKLEDIAYLAGRIGWKGLTAKEYTREGPLFLSVHGLNYGDHVDFRDAFHISQERYDESPEIMLQKDDILLCKDGAGIGKLGIVNHLPAPASINSSLLLIRANESIMPMYLYRVLCGPIFQRLVQERIDGATTPHLYQREIKQIEVPLPPLEEQKRIVAILDEAFEGIEKAQANAEQNLASARELFESYMGGLFKKGRDHWPQKKFKDVCNFVRGPFGGSLKKSCFVKDGIAVYEQQHAINDLFEQIRYFIDEQKFEEMKRFELLPDDLIMSCSGTMGKVAIVPKGARRGIINQALLKLTPNEDVLSDFLKSWMESDDFQDQLKIHTKGVAIKNVASVKVLKEIDIPLPEINEQREIVEKLNSTYTETSKLEAIYEQKLKDLAELKQSLLHKAFSGELASSNVVAFTRPVSEQQAMATTAPEFAANVLAYAHNWHASQQRDRTFGRVKAQKVLHMAESVAGVDMRRQPIKDAAGPNDFQHMLRAEDWAKANLFFEFTPRLTGNGYDFKKLGDYNKLIGGALEAVKPYKDKLEKILALMMPMNTREAEVLATVHAAWNNLLLDNAEITDDAIIHEARENWTESKRSIPENEFRKAMKTIRNNGIVPDGTAKRVIGQESLPL